MEHELHASSLCVVPSYKIEKLKENLHPAVTYLYMVRFQKKNCISTQLDVQKNEVQVSPFPSHVTNEDLWAFSVNFHS